MAISDELRKLVDPNNECCCEHCLSNKCKEWALEHDCELLSCIKSKDRAICDIYSDKYDCKFTHYGETEPEAIFKACQWILDKDSK